MKIFPNLKIGQVAELVFEASFKTEVSYEPEIPILAAWKTGKYLAMVDAESGGNSSHKQKDL